MPRALGLTRVAVVEDHLLFAESLEVALTLEGHDVHRIEVPVQTAVPAGWLLTALLRVRPRVVLLDLDLGSAGPGTRFIEPLVRSRAAVVVVTGDTREAVWGECLRRGARAVLEKTASLNTILATIRLIGDGRPVMSREERERLMLVYHQEKQELQDVRARLARLTPREREVLHCLMEGTTVREIARASFVSEATVRTQVKSILAKLEVCSQLAAVGIAHRVQTRLVAH